MISKISSISPNFSGQVRIGKDDKERNQIAKTIMGVPETFRSGFISAVNDFQYSVSKKTPDSANLTIHMKYFPHSDGISSNNVQIDVTNDNDEDKKIGYGIAAAYFSSYGIEKNFINVVNKSLDSYKKEIISSIKSEGKPENKPPQTEKEVLNLLG